MLAETLPSTRASEISTVLVWENYDLAVDRVLIIEGTRSSDWGRSFRLVVWVKFTLVSHKLIVCELVIAWNRLAQVRDRDWILAHPDACIWIDIADLLSGESVALCRCLLVIICPAAVWVEAGLARDNWARCLLALMIITTTSQTAIKICTAEFWVLVLVLLRTSAEISVAVFLDHFTCLLCVVLLCFLLLLACGF